MTFDLHGHGRRYAPTYGPHGFSDHLPMTWLALQGLGAAVERQQAFAAAYLPRLSALPGDHPARARQDTLLEEIDSEGTDAVVSRYLPALVSGWYRDAYHPMIRLAYAVQFQVPEEAAAALAYMQGCGPDPTLERLAGETRPLSGSGTEVFRRAVGRRMTLAGRSFTSRAETVLAHTWMAELAVEVEDNLRQVSHAALSAFASTHDFFALHLVTGSHAFRILHRFAGPRANAVMNLGLLAGYLAIGAPAIVHEPSPATPAGRVSRDQLLAHCGDDEHDLKVAYTAWDQAAYWDDASYLSVVDAYLDATAGGC